MKLRNQKVTTRRTVISLEKRGKGGKEAVWRDLAKRVSKPRRERVTVNLWKIQKLADKFSGKTLVIPGKVLGTGNLGKATTVAALEFSEDARKKIEGAKGSAISLNELIEKKGSVSSIVIVH